MSTSPRIPGERRPPAAAPAARPPAARGLAAGPALGSAGAGAGGAGEGGPASGRTDHDLGRAERFGHRFESLAPAPAGPVPLDPPIQPMYGVLPDSSGNQLLNLKKRGKGATFKDTSTGLIYEIVPGSTLPHPDPKKKKTYPEIRPWVPPPAKVKAKAKLKGGYDSEGESGSESELDENEYSDYDSEKEDDWEVQDKDPGRTKFFSRSVKMESEHFGVTGTLTDTSHHALAGQLQTGLSTGSTTPPIPLEGVSTTGYVRAMVKAGNDLPTSSWGGTNGQPRQTFSMGDSEVSQQRKPVASQPMNLQLSSFGHYGKPKKGETGIYPSQTVVDDYMKGSGTGYEDVMAERMEEFTSRGKGFQSSDLTSGSGSDKTAKTRRMNALLHLMGREEILRAISKTSPSERTPAGTALMLGLEMMRKDPRFFFKHLIGRGAKYGPMTPEGVASKPEKFRRRFFNVVHRYGKMKLRRNKVLRKLVKKKGYDPKDVGTSFTLVPKKTRLARQLRRTYGKR